MRRTALAVVAACLAAGCGARAPDLLLIQRSGSIPGARLELEISDDGTVRCNRGARRRMSDSQLLSARAAERGLERPASRHLALPPGRNAVLSYRVLLSDGSVSFSDTSPRLPGSLLALQALTRSVATRTCGLPR
ncbi:MAG: hypothetical protein ACJ76S_10710 [Solirubrobacteraceae bacterium]